MIPSWETDESNIPSIRLAEKVGFKKDRKLLCYEFLFDAI
jgi:RimJ/RimL family protein N-acetyltransferase